MTQLKPLADERIAQVLEYAVQSRAPVSIESAGLPSGSINGFVASGDRAALLIQVTGRPALDAAALDGQTCEVWLHSEERYHFATRVSQIVHWGQTDAVAIELPSAISMVERRRVTRAQLAPSSTVQLQWRQNGVNHRHAVPLLNISAEGLACKVDAEQAGALHEGDTVRASFHLPGQNHLYNIEATIANKTPGSTGTLIVGLRFMVNQQAEPHLMALRKALRAPRGSLVTQEGCA